MIVHGRQGCEDVATLTAKHLLNHHKHLVDALLHQIVEQILLIPEIHVKAATGNSRLPDDPVDGRLVIGPLRKFPDCR